MCSENLETSANPYLKLVPYYLQEVTNRMYRVNLVNQVPPQPSGASQQQLVGVLNQMDAGGGGSNGVMLGLTGNSGSTSATNIGSEDAIMTAVKVEPIQHETASTSSTTNGHVVYTTKRPRMEGDDWLSSPSPGSVPSSAPPLSPSPGSQSHNYNNISNGYPSPMSTGSYDPYSPNGKI
uniref:Ecdysone receptor n=2 Tax=Lutzomyia longipalpis TaxID=7200 RepID=A0A1B0CW98_LUTLO